MVYNNNCGELETVLIVATQPKYTGLASEVTHLEINPMQSHTVAVVYKIYRYIFSHAFTFPYLCVLHSCMGVWGA